ncbi:hypothetical protein [Legionella fallonii]|uniref:Uncharacterized protein n=1 Tax=Legionella fallonii LLAP-10 TaxID=1212491 RepID=A0A098G664_9GAMM|nr:hypothetical protein [Legionella fallonii]CEG57459.1 conserved protein of unknown function [Legionella fallonii LLAP-10]
MTIDITKREYRLLLDMVCVAGWMLEAFSEVETQHPEHHGLRTKLFSLYKQMDAEQYIEFDNTLNDYFETQSYEKELQTRFIEPFEDTIFWHELTHRLAMRDAIQEVGKEAFSNMDIKERGKRIDAFEERYQQEFQKNGLDKLIIKSFTS